MNFIPDKPGSTPSYFCTWGAQCALRNKSTLKNESARCFINEDLIFSENGMAFEFEAIRDDLFFILDDGWDVPYGVHPETQMSEFGSLILNEDRFPSFDGMPQERLKKLNEKIKSLGWKGAGLWIAAQGQGETWENQFSPEKEEEYWRERLRWSRFADIRYWKVDWGTHCGGAAFREKLTRLGREEFPELLIEHCLCIPPLNKNGGRFPGFTGPEFNTHDDVVKIFTNSDVFRSYDITVPLSAATTFDRVADLLKIQMTGEALGIINCEDEVYLAAALGFAVGTLCSTVGIKTPKKLDGVVRAVKWQRIAPAFGNSAGVDCYTGDNIVFDSYFFKPGDTWYAEAIGKEIYQGCPAVISRGIPLPHVSGFLEKAPLVVAARNPNGAVSIATLPRTTFEYRETPLSDIELEVGTVNVPIGVFGRYGQLTLVFDRSVNSKTIYAQDLTGYTVHDITNAVTVCNNRIIIPGKLINKIGLNAVSNGDVSEPGLVIVLE